MGSGPCAHSGKRSPPMGLYKIFKKASKFRFTLNDDGGTVILTSPDHPSIAATKLAIADTRIHSQSTGSYQRSESRKVWSFTLKGAAGVVLGTGANHASPQERE